MREHIKIVGIVLWLIVLFLPLSIYLNLRGLAGLSDMATAFPAFGLLAFTLIWSQIILGAFMRPLEKLYPQLFKIHIIQGIAALIFAFLHPFLLLASPLHQTKFAFPPHYDFVSPEMVGYVHLGEIGLLLLVCGVLAGLIRNWQPIKRYWHWVHLVNYGVFFFIFFHSRALGTEVTSSPILNVLWWFFFVTVVIGIVYRRVYIPSQEGLMKATS